MSGYCPVCGFNDLPMTELGCGIVCPACMQGVVADPRYSKASMEWDLKEIDSERAQLERSMTPCDLFRSEQYLYEDPFLKAIRDRKSQQLQDLRQKETLLKQQVEREHRL